MPFSVCNAPATFQRMADRVTDKMKMCAFYLDNIIVHGKSKAELYENLIVIFDCFQKANLHLKTKICNFF